MSDFVIQTNDLTRYFGRKPAVQQVNLPVPKGGVFVLMGRNGSGKTTMIRMLLGLLSPTRGSAEVLGVDSAHLTPEIRSRIGYLTEGHFVYNWMRVGECARFQSGCFPRWNQKLFDGVIDHFGLDLADAASQTINGTGPGTFIRFLMFDPLAALFALDVVILLSALSGWLAYRTAGRYGFTKSETRWWLSLALLLGPAGLLTLLCLRAWPVQQICHACGKLRPEDLALCVNCETAAEAPPHDGTEILVAT